MQQREFAPFATFPGLLLNMNDFICVARGSREEDKYRLLTVNCEFKVFSMQCAVCSYQGTVCSARNTVYSVQRAVCSV